MKNKQKIECWPDLIKIVKNKWRRLIKELRSEFKKDGGEEFLLKNTVRIVWFLLMFKVATILFTVFQRDLFANAVSFLLIQKIIGKLSSQLSYVTNGEFIDILSGAFLKGCLFIVVIIYTILFVYPGAAIQYFNKAIKTYEEKE